MLLSGALIGVGWFGLFVAAHLLAVVRWPRAHRSRTVARLFTVALAGATMTAVLVPLGGAAWASASLHLAVAVLGALVTLACCFVLYMPAYYTVVSSLSGQLLVRLDAAEAGRAPLDTLASPTTFRQIVGTRLDSMVRSGLLSQDAGVYRATPKGRRAARLFRALKSLWQLGPGG